MSLRLFSRRLLTAPVVVKPTEWPFRVPYAHVTTWKTIKLTSLKSRASDEIVAKDTSNKKENEKEKISIVRPTISFDFPRVLNRLPQDIKELSVIDFPLINPWRQDNLRDRMSESEVEFQQKRELILKKASVMPSSFPSVSKVLQVSMSETAKANLERWKSGMIEKLGEVGFIEYQRNLFARGSTLHRSIAQRLQGEAIAEVPKIIDGLWLSLNHVFPNIHEVKVIEQRIAHPFLCYKGIVDCVAVYENELVLIDWKTSSKEKPTLFNLYDEPLQAVAYMGALNYDKTFNYQVDKMALVIAYEDGSPATVHKMSTLHCKDYWKQWLARLKVYYDVTQGSTSP